MCWMIHISKFKLNLINNAYWEAEMSPLWAWIQSSMTPEWVQFESRMSNAVVWTSASGSVAGPAERVQPDTHLCLPVAMAAARLHLVLWGSCGGREGAGRANGLLQDTVGLWTQHRRRLPLQLRPFPESLCEATAGGAAPRSPGCSRLL